MLLLAIAALPMGITLRDYLPNVPRMLPGSLRDWLPEDHLVYYMSDFVDRLDLSAFYAPYEGDGRRNRLYHPAMMLKVLIYAYMVGVFSSRKIAVSNDN